MRRFLPALISLAAAAASPLPFPSAPFPGGVALVPLGPSPKAPEAKYHGLRVIVRPEGEGGNRGWTAVVGIPLSAKPGPDAVEVEGRKVPFTVRDKRYPEQHLKLENQRQVTPNPEDEARIAREQALIGPAWKSWPEGLAPELRFGSPTPGWRTASFGMKRFFNGQARAPHSGLDIAAPQDQAVRAPADGVVVLTGDFFFSGNSVFLAHGEGVVSLFAHLSEVDVKPGQAVKAGELIGKVGKTGRATGPHLHWSLSINDARVDPRLFLGEPTENAAPKKARRRRRR